MSYWRLHELHAAKSLQEKTYLTSGQIQALKQEC